MGKLLLILLTLFSLFASATELKKDQKQDEDFLSKLPQAFGVVLSPMLKSILKTIDAKVITKKEQKLYARDAKQRFMLKAGPSIGVSRIFSYSAHMTRPGIAFNTHMGRIFYDWEIYISSYGIMSTMNNMSFVAQDSIITGAKGVYRSVSFGPTFKYSTRWVIFNNWKLYIQFGPLVSQQTFKIKFSKIQGGRFQNQRKLSFEGPGGLIGFGIDQINTLYKFKAYVELAYKYIQSKKFSVVGGTEIDAAIFEQEYGPKVVKEHTVLLNVGFYLF